MNLVTYLWREMTISSWKMSLDLHLGSYLRVKHCETKLILAETVMKVTLVVFLYCFGGLALIQVIMDSKAV